MHSYSLFELNEYIKRVIALNFNEPIWVNAEIAQLKETRGQVYLELVEHDESTGQVTAQSSAVIWYKSYLFIKNKLGDLISAVLNEGSHVLIKVSVEFNERYGLKLIITDVDPSFTIGQMEMARKKILERLAREELLELNKALSLPSVIQKIAVISSRKAAGYQDFMNHLKDNTFGYTFRTDLFPCAMQGQNVEREVVQAIRQIDENPGYDCIVMIRGGGSKLDLSYFDNYNIACAIARSQHPVLSGIGHDIDQSVTDIVSFLALKTPTAVADFIVERNLAFESSILRKGATVQNISRALIDTHKVRLASFQQLLSIQPAALISGQRSTLDTIQKEMHRSAIAFIHDNWQKLDNMSNFIDLSDPVQVLKKGYAMVLKKEKVITSSGQVAKGDILDLHMHDGNIKTRVQ